MIAELPLATFELPQWLVQLAVRSPAVLTQRPRLARLLLDGTFRRFSFVRLSERAPGRVAQLFHGVLDLGTGAAGVGLILCRRVNRTVRGVTVLGGSNVNGQKDEREGSSLGWQSASWVTSE